MQYEKEKMMKRSSGAIVAVMVFMGVLAVGCTSKPAEQKQTEQKQTEQKPATEKTPAKKGPVGC